MSLLSYDRLIVLDFEATCIKDSVIRPQEIIEFPLVVIDVIKGEIIENQCIQIYIKPIHCPKLSEFCINLTGITQDDVDNAVEFPIAMKLILAFLQEHNFINQTNWTFITCGNWDLEKMLPQQATLSKIKPHSCFKKWINVQDEFFKITKQKGKGMLDMLNKLNIDLIGRHHSGIDDCRNIARIVIRLLEILKQNN